MIRRNFSKIEFIPWKIRASAMLILTYRLLEGDLRLIILLILKLTNKQRRWGKEGGSRENKLICGREVHYNYKDRPVEVLWLSHSVSNLTAYKGHCLSNPSCFVPDTNVNMFFPWSSKTDSETTPKYKNTLKTTMQTSVALSFLTFLLKSVVLQLNERIYFKHLFEEFPAKTKMRIKMTHSFSTLNNPV